MSRRIVVFFAILSLVMATGCSSTPESAGGGPSVEQLKLPPDLNPTQQSTAMAIPTVRTVNAGAGKQSDAAEPVLPKPENVTLQRDGRERWLKVQASPAQVWRGVEAFVKQHKLKVARSDPRLGVVETAWRYGKMPLNRDVFAPSDVDRAAASVADRYVIRLEEGVQQGTTEVFVAHRCVARDQQDNWRLHKADPFLEAEFLRALLVSLGGATGTPAAHLAEPAGTSAVHPQVQRLADGTSALVLHDSFFNAWREVGLALDRGGFTVVDRNRSMRHYFVRYDTRAEQGPKDKGFWDTVAFWRNDIPDTVKKYRLDLIEANGNTQVTVQDVDGKPAAQDIAGKILTLIAEQLR